MALTAPTRDPLLALSRLRGTAARLPLYAAVRVQARRCLDDWIPLSALERFESLARDLGLVVVRDCVFEPLPEEGEYDALKRSPTTQNRGLPLSRMGDAVPGSSVHVFVSTRSDWAEEALVSFSYPVVVPEDRLLIRPRVDATRLGAAFGYPSCCIQAFLRWNDWHQRSHYSQVYRSAEVLDWRVNCLPKDTPWMTIFQTPCEPSCPACWTMSQRTWDAVAKMDPTYAESIAAYLSGVFVIINEAVVFRLEEPVRDGGESYRFRRAEWVGQSRVSVPPQVDAVRELFEGASWVSVEDGIIHTEGNGRQRFYEVDPESRWVDDPCIVRFA